MENIWHMPIQFTASRWQSHSVCSSNRKRTGLFLVDVREVLLFGLMQITNPCAALTAQFCSIHTSRHKCTQASVRSRWHTAPTKRTRATGAVLFEHPGLGPLPLFILRSAGMTTSILQDTGIVTVEATCATDQALLSRQGTQQQSLLCMLSILHKFL